MHHRIVATLLIAAAALLAIAAPAAAQQSEPRASIAGGYAWFREQGSSGLDPTIYPLGWVATGSYRLWGRLAGVGEFANNTHKNAFDESQTLQSILGGAKFAITRSSRLTTFAQFLAGLERFSEPGFNESALAIQAGFGVDIRMGARAFVRTQVDYRRSQPDSGTFNDVRVFAGVGITVGK